MSLLSQQPHLYHVQQELSKEKNRLSDLFKRLDKEQQDVKRLEGISLTGLFYRILGSKDDQLAIERQEALAALLKWEKCSKTCESLLQPSLS